MPDFKNFNNFNQLILEDFPYTHSVIFHTFIININYFIKLQMKDFSYMEASMRKGLSFTLCR